MLFHSILFRAPGDGPQEPTLPNPSFFGDLHLDQIVAAIAAMRSDYDLAQFFHAPLRNLDAIVYRHEVMCDLEKARVFEFVATFSRSMRAVRDSLKIATKSSYEYEKVRLFLDGARTYCDAVRTLAEELHRPDVQSEGLRAFCLHLERYLASVPFRQLQDDAAALLADLSHIGYCVLIRGDRVTVRECRDEPDLVETIQATFSRFKQGATKSYLVAFEERPAMNHIEAKVLDMVALLFPEVFANLERFNASHVAFLDESILAFDREVQFYAACIEYARSFEQAGLAMCYPHVDAESKEVFGEAAFDLSLAQKLIGSDLPVVCNDFRLSGAERIFVVSGPNQGGKTTFARTFGQMQYLAALGCRVAGQSAATFLFDAMFTHFERQEDPGALHGKLEDDVLRIYAILERATPASIVIMNEIFSSTTAGDASVLAQRIVRRILDLDALCVCVTFIDELSILSEKTVSMVTLVEPSNPDVRTYKLARRPADGLAYAVSLAEKYGLTYERLNKRLTERARG